MPGNQDNAFLRADTGAGRHHGNRLSGNIRANNGEIAASHFQYLRAGMTT